MYRPKRIDTMLEYAKEMEPLLPSRPDEALVGLALRTARESSALGSLLSSSTRIAVTDLLRQMNSYYSNLIEGHNTNPFDIERALKGDYSTEPAKRALQLESLAHIEVQKLMEQKLASDSGFNIGSADFLRWIHYEFYTRMPEEFRLVSDQRGRLHKLDPGELRKRDVIVGHHVPPAHSAVPEFLQRFSEFYDPQRLHGLDRIIAAAASHHRLAWIHPFVDGNGRVTRLFTHAFQIRTGLDANGLWTISRGLSRRRESYLSALGAADQPRAGDLDGRGSLSSRGLSAFCKFFFESALDQIQFMRSLLDIEGLQKRMAGYVERRAASRELAPEAAYVLREVSLRGEVPRGDIPRITGKPERTARRILGQLLNESLLVSDTPKGPVRIGLPSKVVGYYFPRLYPLGVEPDL
jgi:Fic family protein